ncbi:MAG TPA: hypothetical protein VFB62_09420 [Polyangiaceae bacterium]|nr:hypothetical protein [Polyangiaceae bacterium]
MGWLVAGCGNDETSSSNTQASTTSSTSVSSTAAATNGAGGSAGASGGGGAGGAGTQDTWSNYAYGFFETYCFECHGPGDQLRDYSMFQAVQAESATIRCGVAPTLLSGCDGSPAPNQFPISNATNSNQKPNAAERDRLVAWIDAGMPQ